jgi:phosphoribosylanthranilate isomerase
MPGCRDQSGKYVECPVLNQEIIQMRPRVKICCISTQEEAQIAIRAGADALGLVGAMPSGPGVIEDHTIRAISLGLPAAVSAFLLTQELTADAIIDHVIRCAVSTVQIVNHVDPVELQRLRHLMPALRIVQVLHLEGSEALHLVRQYEEFVHSFLLDSGSPGASIPLLGGTGRTHDWAVSAQVVLSTRRPVFLAGGLTPANVADAMRVVQPYGLDICSGVRTAGRLDVAKLRSYIQAIGSRTS